MKLRRLSKKALVGGAVSLGTAGLSSCGTGGGGVVDPPPPPLGCTDLNSVRDLQATVALEDIDLLVARVNYVGQAPAVWKSLPEVTVVEGATARTVRAGDKPAQEVGSSSSRRLRCRLASGSSCRAAWPRPTGRIPASFSAVSPSPSTSVE
jgi:hypothetical protein